MNAKAADSMLDPARIIAGLPRLPGVYRMVNEAGELLYVGKALDLRKRVASYFRKQEGQSPRIRLMLSQVATVETTVTRSEAEALLLENNLIKTRHPKYNILFRDDKSYPYLVITGHRYPRLGFHRGTLDKGNRYFGPFPNAGAVRESIQLLQKVFHVRTCEDTVFQNRSRPCLLHQIRRCTAPCVGLVTDAEYSEDVRSAVLFLSGKEDEVISHLIARMDTAAKDLRYEDAATCRDQIAALRKVKEKQYVSDGAAGDVDVVACVRVSGLTCVNLVMIRGGRHLGDRNFLPRNAEDANDDGIIESFLAQHYLEHPVPGEIVVGVRVAAEALEQMLTERCRRTVRIVMGLSGTRRIWLEMALRNARLSAERTLALQATQETRLTALHKALDLPESVQRIECFDVSHMMGEAAVASCVVYDKSALQKSEYRRYNISSVAPGDDYGAMREVMSRRYCKIMSGESKMPDLVIVDGGKGQLAVAREVLSELGMLEVPLLAVAKGEQRKPGLEQLILHGAGEPFRLSGDDSALHLIQQIRDEAHRFAIAGHRTRRGRARNQSPLEGISGVGATRRRRLLARFGGLRGLLAASVEDLMHVEGINRALAERIHRELH
jgi:excinuclease ABC subunit C